MRNFIITVVIAVLPVVAVQGQTVYSVKYKSEADVKVYVAKYKSEAEWKDKAKKHPMAIPDFSLGMAILAKPCALIFIALTFDTMAIPSQKLRMAIENPCQRPWLRMQDSHLLINSNYLSAIICI